MKTLVQARRDDEAEVLYWLGLATRILAGNAKSNEMRLAFGSDATNILLKKRERNPRRRRRQRQKGRPAPHLTVRLLIEATKNPFVTPNETHRRAIGGQNTRPLVSSECNTIMRQFAAHQVHDVPGD